MHVPLVVWPVLVMDRLLKMKLAAETKLDLLLVSRILESSMLCARGLGAVFVNIFCTSVTAYG